MMFRCVKSSPSRLQISAYFLPLRPVTAYTGARKINTYGLSSSAFLAQLTLHQLVEGEGSKFPLASRGIMHKTYVDDVITRFDSSTLRNN